MVAAIAALATILLQAGESSRCFAGLVTPDGKRAVARAAKGVELYSWQTRDGALRFSFLPGTNRLKTEREVKSAACVLSSTTQVKSMLERLAEGEQVYWGGDPRECPSCSFPNPEVVADVVAHAARIGVTVHAIGGKAGE